MERDFLPWLVDRVDEHLQKAVLSRKMLDELIRKVVKERLEQFAKLEEAAAVAEAQEEAARGETTAAPLADVPEETGDGNDDEAGADAVKTDVSWQLF